VLEMGNADVGKGNKGINENDTMRKKREQHDIIIAKTKTQRETQQPTDSDQQMEEMTIYPTTEEIESTEGTNNPKKRKRDGGKKKERPTTFRDTEFFLSHFPKNQHKEEGLTVNGDISLDLLPDEGETLAQRKNQLKWDRKKKKYVRASTLDAKKKMIANESGVLVDAKAPLKVSKYEQWSRKTKKKIPVVGEKENAATVKEVLAGGRKYRHNQVQPSEEDAKLGLKTKEEIHKERKRKEKRKFGPKKKAKVMAKRLASGQEKGSAWRKSKILAFT